MDEIRQENRPLRELIARFRNGDLLLPDFQRDFEWPVDDQIAPLLASLILGYPIGTLLIGRATSKAFRIKSPESFSPDSYARTLAAKCLKKGVKAPGEAPDVLAHKKAKDFEADYLFDGQQRLTSVDLIFGRGFHYSPLHHTYKHRWFLNLKALGLSTLKWPNLSEYTHDQLLGVSDESAVVVHKRYTRVAPLKLATTEAEEEAFYKWCESEKLFPLDELFLDTSSATFHQGLLDRLVTLRRGMIIEDTDQYREALRKSSSGKATKATRKAALELVKPFQEWKQGLATLLDQLYSFSVPCIVVHSGNLARVAGIFEVTNKQGLKLEIFDLLLARSVQPGERSIRESFQSAIVASTGWSLPNGFLPHGASANFWDPDTFLAGKRAAEGKEVPEPVRRPYAQCIALLSRMRHALGSDWHSKALGGHFPSLAQLRHLIKPSGQHQWQFTDKEILRTARSDVMAVQDIAAKQLLRAYIFAHARLGVPRLSLLPYRQMDLVLSAVLTDPVWSNVVSHPNDWRCARLEWWYWASLFGGAYQQSQDRRVLEDIPRLMWYLADQDHVWPTDLHPGSGDEALREDAVGAKRFESVMTVAGYSDWKALAETIAIGAMGNAIRQFTIRRGCRDFQSKSAAGWSRGPQLTAGSDNLHADHLFARSHYDHFCGEQTGRSDDHPVNSALNFTFISADANRSWSNASPLDKLELAEAAEDHTSQSYAALRSHLLDPNVIIAAYDGPLKGQVKKKKEYGHAILMALLKTRYQTILNALTDLRGGAGG